MVSARQIAERLGNCGLPIHWRGEPPAKFDGLAADSRRVEPGFLFVAIRGSGVDGHAFVGEAQVAGARGAVVERIVSGVRIPQIVVPDSRLAAAHLASLFEADPGERLHLVGVTGTNGKTTTTWIVRHLLSELGPSVALGTLGTIDASGERHKGDLTTPEPIQLMATLHGIADQGIRFLAMEVSSHGLDQRRVDALQFEAAVFTNVTREHLDYHRDMEEYRLAKLRLASLVGPEGVCVVNADEPAWRGRFFDHRRVVRFGLSDGADLRAVDPTHDSSGSRWRLQSPYGDATVVLPLVGEFNILNALGAAGAALELGVPLSSLVERLGTVPQVPGRMEILRREPALVVRDYAHTPDAIAGVMRTLTDLAGGRIIVVFGCGGDRDRGKRPLMGQAVHQNGGLAIVTTDNPRSEDPAEIARQIVSDLPAEGYEVVLDRAQAIARALELAGARDVVLLAGKGHERAQIIGEDVIPFDEAEVVADLLAGGVR